MKITEDILNHADCGFVVAFVSLDISAAFDMVNHYQLLNRLHVEFGINSAAEDWIATDLSARCFLCTGQSSYDLPMLESLEAQCLVQCFSEHC